MTETVSTRSSRNRRVVALMGWACLVATAFFLWNARQTGSVRTAAAEPAAFILAAFAAFVGVFSWMLFNPGRRSAAESPSLFFAAASTLFPPPIIGFCLMPIDSPLRGWLALGLFLLCVIAILSHVPDEFFGVPRGRHTYLTPIPAFDRVEGTVLDPNASWFRFEDLSRIVADKERPSLAPRAYLQRDTVRVSSTTRPETRVASEVDDILGADFDLGLLEDTIIDDAPTPRASPAPPYSARPTSTSSASGKSHRDHDEVPRQPVREREPREESRRVESFHSRTAQPVQVPQDLGKAPREQPEPLAQRDRVDQAEVGDRRQSRHNETRRRRETVPERSDAIIRRPEPSARPADSAPTVIPVPFGPVAPTHGFLEPASPTPQPLAGRSDNVATSTQYGRVGSREKTETHDVSRRERDRGGRQTRYDDAIRSDTIQSETVPPQGLQPQTVQPQIAQPPTKQRTVLAESTEPAAESQPSRAIQRTKDASGSELVEGVMKVHFDQGQKRANIHIPFSPPLAGLPEVECECVGGESLRLKVPVRQSYGIRIEARRSSADQPLDADIGFAAVYTAE